MTTNQPDPIPYEPLPVPPNWLWAIERHKQLQNERDQRMARYAKEKRNGDV